MTNVTDISANATLPTNVRSLLDQSSRVTKVRARAPLRISFAGGGTDLPSYSNTFGGCVLNATIEKYAYCSIEVRDDRKVKFAALDYELEFETSGEETLAPTGDLALHKAVHRHRTALYGGADKAEAPQRCHCGIGNQMVSEKRLQDASGRSRQAVQDADMRAEQQPDRDVVRRET